MKQIKSFIPIKTVFSVNDINKNEVCFCNDLLFFKTAQGELKQLNISKRQEMYGLIYGIRIKVNIDDEVNSLTDDKIERVLIVRTINNLNEYVDYEYYGEDTGLTFYLENGEFKGSLNTYFPFVDFKEEKIKDPGGSELDVIDIPLFFKNKEIVKQKPEGDYIYYLVSKFLFDDFYPSESHITQEGDYCKSIKFSQDWEVIDISNDWPELLQSTTGRYDKKYRITKNVWFSLFYLYMIKSASFFPFKNLVNDYNSVCYSSCKYNSSSGVWEDGKLQGIKQTSTFTIDSFFRISNITLHNIDVDECGFFVGQNLVCLIGIEDRYYYQDYAPDIISFLQTTSHTKPCYDALGYVESIEDNKCSIKFNFRTSNENLESESKPFILFLKQTPYSSEEIDLKRNTYINLDRMNIDGIKNIFPVFYSYINSVQGTELDRNYYPELPSYTLNEAKNYIKKKYNYSTPIFSSVNSNYSYPQTYMDQNVVKITDTNQNDFNCNWFYCDKYQLKSLNIVNQHTSNLNSIYSRNNIIANYWILRYYSTISSLNISKRIMGNLEGVIHIDNLSDSLFFEFVGLWFFDSNYDQVFFGWNYLDYESMNNTCFNNMPSSFNKESWCPENYLNSKYIVSRSLYYCD